MSVNDSTDAQPKFKKDHPDYRVFKNMMNRCRNKNAEKYARYGGRGIAVCDRLVTGGFWQFNKDMGDRPTAKHSIDRIDNDGPYSPENCRWATHETQANNASGNTIIEYDGIKLNCSQWAKRFGLSYNCFMTRLKLGMSMDYIANNQGIDLTKKLTEEQKAEARKLFMESDLSLREIGSIYGVSAQCLSPHFKGLSRKFTLHDIIVASRKRLKKHAIGEAN